MLQFYPKVLLKITKYVHVLYYYIPKKKKSIMILISALSGKIDMYSSSTLFVYLKITYNDRTIKYILTSKFFYEYKLLTEPNILCAWKTFTESYNFKETINQFITTLKGQTNLTLNVRYIHAMNFCHIVNKLIPS